ncbi:hypothetical protein SteCoe_32816 [Stentor coeruleus]|uniref:Uncharacterized protein n=1 Tax=Stentor coeruleus TaxID=5963 RepID=A0A1R2AY77_9CILI|nr:hypothetical protein SteCoe_32816 [Stentor coeruleus]
MLIFIFFTVKAFEISTVPTSGPPPAPILNNKATFNPDSNQIIVFGGQDATTLKFKNTLHTFSIENLVWGEIIPESYENPPGLGFSEIFLTEDKRLLVFFGSMKNSISGNVYSFDLETKKCALEKLTGDYIEGRVYYSSICYYYNSTKFLAIYGGLTSKGIDNNLYI